MELLDNSFGAAARMKFRKKKLKFMQDNKSGQSSQKTKMYFIACDFDPLRRPPQSHKFNPIEKIILHHKKGALEAR